MESKPKLKPAIPFLFIILFFGLFGCSRSSNTETKSATSTPATATFSEVVAADYSDSSPVVGWIGDYAVTLAELNSFSRRHLQTSHSDPHGGSAGAAAIFDPVKSFTAYVPYRLLVVEAGNRGITNEVNVEDWKELRLITAMAPSYPHYLKENAVIDTEELSRAIPSEMTKVNFALKVFGTMEEAWEARKKISTFEEFRLLRETGVEAGKRGLGEYAETGLVWPNSGFFNRVDDGFLFELHQGDISDPVESGLGPAVCYVLERKDYSEEEKNRYLADIREELAEDYVRKTLAEQESSGPYTVDRDLLDTIWSDGRLDEDELSMTVMTFQGRPVTYRLAHLLYKFNYTWMKRTYPPERYGSWAAGQLVNLGKALTRGGKAIELGLPFPDGIATVLRQELEDVLYYTLQQRLLLEVDSDDVADEDARKYYLNNPEQFRTRDRMEIEYYYSPYLDGLDEIYRMVQSGVDFRTLQDKVAADQEQAGKTPHAMSGSDFLKHETLYRGTPSLPGVKEDPFRYGVGDAALFRTDTGSYLIHVLSIVPGEVPEFDEEVSEMVKSRMIQQLRRQYVNEVIRELRNNTEIIFGDRDSVPPKGIRGNDNLDRG